MTWQLSGTKAQFTSDSFRFSIDVSAPSAGLSNVSVQGEELSNWRLLRVDWNSTGLVEPIAEHYVRGSDLVATYLQTSRRTVRPQLYWRNLGPRWHGNELLVSVQTSLLESDPKISVSSELGQGETYRFENSTFQLTNETIETDSNLILFRPADSRISYVEIIHPTDCERLCVEFENDFATTRCHLFHHDLEKGVIRRGRVRSLFIPREDDFDTATDLLAQFEQSAAPLTT